MSNERKVVVRELGPADEIQFWEERALAAEAEVQALKDQRLSWCRAANEARHHAMWLEAEIARLKKPAAT